MIADSNHDGKHTEIDICMEDDAVYYFPEFALELKKKKNPLTKNERPISEKGTPVTLSVRSIR